MADGDRGSDRVPDRPGWYPDPWSATGRGERYFDGKRWGSTERPLARQSRVENEPRRTGSTRSLRGWRRLVRPIALVAVLLVGAWALTKFQERDSGTTRTASPVQQRVVPAEPTDRPPASAEEESEPLGAPAPVPPGAGQFEVLAHQRGDTTTPVAFDPCRPIHYVVNPAGAPEDGPALVQDAIERMSIATGLQFIDDGPSTEAPSKDREPYLPDRYDQDRWAPVLISWAEESTYPALAGYITGIGSAQPVYADDGRLVYVTGQVVLDAQELSTAALPDRAEARAVILHELGHVVGLDHTSDRNQIMFSESQLTLTDFADGDRRGLALLGTQDCFPGV